MRPNKGWLNYWIGTDSSKLGEWDVQETVQGFPTAWIRQIQKIVIGENVDVEEFSQNNKQELVYSAEAVAKRLSK